MHLSTNHKADGDIYLTMEDAGKYSGKAFGLIRYDLALSQYRVTTRLDNTEPLFYSRQAAEYHALALAYEYLEIDRLSRDVTPAIPAKAKTEICPDCEEDTLYPDGHCENCNHERA